MSYLVFALCIMIPTALCTQSIFSARIESCRGCSLNRLPEVKAFIHQDVPEYERVSVTFISGAPPELVLLSHDDIEIERLPLSQLDRKQCNELLHQKGFVRKQKNEF